MTFGLSEEVGERKPGSNGRVWTFCVPREASVGAVTPALNGPVRVVEYKFPSASEAVKRILLAMPNTPDTYRPQVPFSAVRLGSARAIEAAGADASTDESTWVAELLL